MDGNTNMTTIQDVLGDIGAGEAMQPIGVAQIRTAMDTLNKYKDGKSALESGSLSASSGGSSSTGRK